MVRTIIFASRAKDFDFQVSAIATIDTTVIEITDTFSIYTIAMSTTVVRARNGAITFTTTPSF